MQIDWFTFGAQIVNFLILVALLKHFLYNPVVRAMDEREAEIARRLEHASNQRKEAEQQAAQYRQQQKELKQQRGEVLNQAREEAAQCRKKLLEEARQEVEQTRLQWQQELQQNREAILQDVRARAGREVLSATRQALDQLAGQEVEELIIDRFVERLGDTDEETLAEIKRAARDSAADVVVRSAFEMPEKQATRVAEAIEDRLEAEAEFQTAPDIIGGIEVRVDGYVLEWSLSSYLAGLEDRLARVLEALGSSGGNANDKGAEEETALGEGDEAGNDSSAAGAEQDQGSSCGEAAPESPVSGDAS